MQFSIQNVSNQSIYLSSDASGNLRTIATATDTTWIIHEGSHRRIRKRMNTLQKPIKWIASSPGLYRIGPDDHRDLVFDIYDTDAV